MTDRRPPRRTAWALRSAALLLVALVAAVGSPAVAGATTLLRPPDPTPTTTVPPPSTTVPQLTTTVPRSTTVLPTTPSPVPLTTGAAPSCAPLPTPPTGPVPSCPSASALPPASPTTTSVAPAVTPDAVVPTSADDSADPAVGPPYGTVARPLIPAGQQQTATGHDFAPGSRVRVTLQPEGIELGTFTAAPDGSVTTHYATTGLLVGSHTVRWTQS